MQMKKITRINHRINEHWVGNGFPVSTMFSYEQKDISPFLLLDYAGPAVFEPTEHPRGVGQHPHRGFETVTIVYQGEVAHRDNAGNSGQIGPGDVQWMTAARGILHEERHGPGFTKNGGTLEMIQLWVNLPAKDKMRPPHYQEILNNTIPVITLENDTGFIRVIAGEYQGIKGAAKTFTPINLWDMRLNAGHQFNLPLPDGFTTMVLVLSGEVKLNDEKTIHAKELAFFERSGDCISLETIQNTVLLILNGEPIDEPVVGQGPFVMNTEDEIKQAMNDYYAGRF